MNPPTSTREHINRLIEFRQAIYAEGFLARRDALFEVLDALLAMGAPTSFALLSQSERFQRRWPSLYAAVEEGRIARAWLRRFLIRQVPQRGICIFPLDGSSWPRPRARTLPDLQSVYQASSDVNGGTEALDIVPADGKYGNAGFLRQVRGLRVGVLRRLRRERVLYWTPPPPATRRRGRPRKHGERFAFPDSTTWGSPAEIVEFEDAHYGTVRLERWNNLHERQAAEVSYDVLRASIHRERVQPPAPVLFRQ